MTNGEILYYLLTLPSSMITHVTSEIGPAVNGLETTMSLMLRDFVRTNPSIFLCSNVGEDPKILLMLCIRC